MEREQELIDGFLSRRAEAEKVFVAYFQKLLRMEIGSNHPKLLHSLADLEQEALVRVCELRDNPKKVWRICTPLSELAKFAADAPARRLARVKRWPSLDPRNKKHDRPVVSNQLAALELKEMIEIAESLPRGMARTMLAHEAHEAGEGPPLAEALGVSSDNARRRLARAQRAAIDIAAGEDVEMPEEDPDE